MVRVSRRLVRESEEALASAAEALCLELFALGIDADEVQRHFRRGYVLAAYKDLVKAGQKPTVSQISAATGLTRKEVSAILRGDAPKRGPSETPAMRVVESWKTSPRFQTRSGAPRVLSLVGNTPSFEELVKEYAGDVTPASVLNELERLQLVRRTNRGAVKLIVSSELRRVDRQVALQMLLGKIREFILAASTRKKSGDFAQSVGSFRTNCEDMPTVIAFRKAFSSRGTEFLSSFGKWAQARNLGSKRGGRTIGVGFYLIDESSSVDKR